MGRDEPAGFREYVDARGDSLLRAAQLLTGDADLAEDLVQTALVKAFLAWDRVSSRERPDAYMHRVLVTTFLSWRRRRWWREIVPGNQPDVIDSRDDIERATVRQVLWQALLKLPPRQRAVVMLRYYADYSEEDVALALGCSVGTVKSQAAKAMQKLRGSGVLRALTQPEGARYE